MIDPGGYVSCQFGHRPGTLFGGIGFLKSGFTSARAKKGEGGARAENKARARLRGAHSRRTPPPGHSPAMPVSSLPHDFLAAGEARMQRLEARAAAGPPAAPPPAALADALQIARGFASAIRGGVVIDGLTLGAAEM